jgi:hypothetical protein
MSSAFPWLLSQAHVATSASGPFGINMPWFGWVAIVAILMMSMSGAASALLRHRERMAMIRMGMHPDACKPTEPEAVGKPYHPEGCEL